MNVRLFFLFSLFFLAGTASQVQAAEAAALDRAVLAQPVKAAADLSASLVITPDGQLISKPGSIFTVGGNYSGMELPYLISAPKPIAYPHWAVRQGWEGDFVIAIEVLKNGSVGRYKVMKSTGHQRLDQAAVHAVQSWKFHPAMKNGQSIVTCVELPVRFELQG